MHVQLDDEIAVRVEPPRHPVGKERRQLYGRPAEEMSVGKAAGGEQAVESRSRFGLIEQARRRCRIDANVRMMHDAWITWPELDAADIFRRTHRNRDHEIPEYVRPTGRELVRIRQRHDEIGLSQAPALGEPRRGGERRPVAL